MLKYPTILNPIGALGSDMKKISKEVPVRLNTKKSLIEMNKNINMCNRVWIQMMKLQIQSVNKATEEIRSREGQSPFDKMIKHNNLINIFLGITLTERRVPFHQILGLQKTLSNKIQKVVS